MALWPTGLSKGLARHKTMPTRRQSRNRGQAHDARALPAGASCCYPPSEPGAHIKLKLPNGLERHYSLCENSQGHATKCLGYEGEDFAKTLLDVLVRKTLVSEVIQKTPLPNLLVGVAARAGVELPSFGVSTGIVGLTSMKIGRFFPRDPT